MLYQLAQVGGVLHVGGGVLGESHVVWRPCVRIITSEYARENLFDRLSTGGRPHADAEAMREIADLTNPAVQHEAGLVNLVRPADRIFGPGAGLVMASFAFPGRPSRFSDGSAGVYYAARALSTAIAETRFHEARMLAGSGPCDIEKSVIEAELDGWLVDIRGTQPAPDGVYHPVDYRTGQAFGGLVRRLEGYGVVYDSVREPGGECVAVFRPPVLAHARVTRTLTFSWDGVRVASVR